jgi:hypothetical protein
MLEGFREELQKSNHRKKYMFMNTFRNKNRTAHHMTAIEDVILPITSSNENGEILETEERTHPLLSFNESPLRKWLSGSDKRQLEIENEQLRMEYAEKIKRQQDDFQMVEKVGLNSIKLTDSIMGPLTSIDDDEGRTAAAVDMEAMAAIVAKMEEDGKPDNKIAEQAISVALGGSAETTFGDKSAPKTPATTISNATTPHKSQSPSTAPKSHGSAERPPSSMKKPGAQKKQLKAAFSDVLPQQEEADSAQVGQKSGSGGSARSSIYQELKDNEAEEAETDPALASIIKDIKSILISPSTESAAGGGARAAGSVPPKKPAQKTTYTIEQLEKLEQALLVEDDNAEGGLNKTLAAFTAANAISAKLGTSSQSPQSKTNEGNLIDMNQQQQSSTKSRTVLSSHPADFVYDDNFVIPAVEGVINTPTSPGTRKRVLQLDRLRDAQRTAYPFRRDLSTIKRWEPLNISAISDMRHTIFGSKFTASGVKDVSSLPPIKSTEKQWGVQEYEVKRSTGQAAKVPAVLDFWNVLRFEEED